MSIEMEQPFFDSGESVVIWGGSALGRAAFECLKERVPLRAFVDSDPDKQGMLFCGLPVLSASDITPADRVLIASIYYGEIGCQLREMGVRAVWVFDYADSIVLDGRKSFAVMPLADTERFDLALSHGIPPVGLSRSRSSRKGRRGEALKRVLVVAYIFPPLGGGGAQRTTKFVRYLRDFGWDPLVVTVGKHFFQEEEDHTLLEELPADLDIIRIDHDLFHTEQLGGEDFAALLSLVREVAGDDAIVDRFVDRLRADGYARRGDLFCPDKSLGWVLRVLQRLAGESQLDGVEAIFTTALPYSSLLAGYYLKAWLDVPWVVDFRDEWTLDPYIEERSRGDSLIVSVEQAMERNVLRAADRVLYVTPISTAKCIDYFGLPREKVLTLFNGYDERDFVGLPEVAPFSLPFTIHYNGSLYYNRVSPGFIEAINGLVASGTFRSGDLKVVMRGRAGDELKRFIKERDRYDCFEFRPYAFHRESLKEAAGAHLLLLVTGDQPRHRLILTGKLFEYLRLGLPILALTPEDSLVEGVLRETEVGRCFRYTDSEGMAGFIEEVWRGWESGYRVRPPGASVTRFERREQARVLASLLDEMVTDYGLL